MASTHATTMPTTTEVISPPPTHMLVVEAIKKRLNAIQAYLEFASFQQKKENTTKNDESSDDSDDEEDDAYEYPQFATKYGLGRVALLGTVLGILWGVHFAGALSLTIRHCFYAQTSRQQDDDDNSDDRFFYYYLDTRRLFDFFAWQWCTYAMTVCAFHALEFYVTALYNPTTCTADSFLINHSISYTAAAISSWMEFFSTRTLILVISVMTNRGILQIPILHDFVMSCVRSWIQWSHWSFALGIIISVVGQVLRSLAMKTAGESFNHLIQTRRKDNHVLITHGIYATFRHPSYVGFYYWSLGTQLVLSNGLNAVALAVVACNFFQRRIPYEEESLARHFPDEYPAYVKRTWMGIPFIPRTDFIIETTETTALSTTNRQQQHAVDNNNKKQE